MTIANSYFDDPGGGVLLLMQGSAISPFMCILFRSASARSQSPVPVASESLLKTRIELQLTIEVLRFSRVLFFDVRTASTTGKGRRCRIGFSLIAGTDADPTRERCRTLKPGCPVHLFRFERGDQCIANA